ncbi:AraC family transcriptional regulator [Atopomonas hussainii]|uniref:AraC family transcriptional regulator n=1 Tax=Atopomonas hussainii TaxID=1429083 RepID=UPI0008FFF069|nr:AraC family transcriptional regulator [Atopomonas hussainii]
MQPTASLTPLTHSITLRRFLFEALERLGFDPAQVYRQAFQGADWVQGFSEGREAHELAPRFWQAIEPLTGDSDIGLHLAEAMRPRFLDVASYLLLSAPNLRQGLQALLKFQALLSGGLLAQLEEHDGSAWLIIDLNYRGFAHLRQQSECLSLLLFKLLHWLTDEQLTLQAVHWRHPAPRTHSEHQRLLAAPLHFSAQHDALVFSAAWLDKPSRHACAEVFQALSREAQQQLDSLQEDRWLARLRYQLARQLDSGAALPTQAQCAQALGLRTAQLQQMLKAQGMGFRGVLDSVRQACVSELINTELPLKEVARRLGYAELSPFYRAFRRWFGQTPQAYRRTRRGAPPG